MEVPTVPIPPVLPSRTHGQNEDRRRRAPSFGGVVRNGRAEPAAARARSASRVRFAEHVEEVLSPPARQRSASRARGDLPQVSFDAAIAAASAPEVQDQQFESPIDLDEIFIWPLLRSGLRDVQAVSQRFRQTCFLAPMSRRLLLRGAERCSDECMDEVQIAVASINTARGEGRPPECSEGISCYNDACSSLHPNRWYTDRCSRGSSCLYSDCSKVHLRRARPCPSGPDCQGFTARCGHLHPKTWYLQGYNEQQQGPVHHSEHQLPFDDMSIEWLRRGGLHQVCAVASQFNVTAHLSDRHLILRGDQPQLLHAAEEINLVVVQHVSFMQESRAVSVVETDEIPEEKAEKIKGSNWQLMNMLQRDLQVSLTFADVASAGRRRLRLKGVRSNLDIAIEKLELLLVDLTPAEQQLRQERAQDVFVFIDNSNLHVNCQTQPDGSKDFSARLKIRGLANMMIGARRCQRRVVVGSKPPQDHSIWQYWRSVNFEVKLSQRDLETNREDNVDQALVAEANMALLSRRDRPAILVLGTGDGNLHGQLPGTVAANFRNLVMEALHHNWHVELWTWRASCSRFYLNLCENRTHQDRFKIIFLDGFRDQVSFCKGRGQAAAAAAAAAADSYAGDEDDGLCTVCMEEVATHCFKPCNHRIICEADARRFQAGQATIGYMALCAHCRTPWTSIEP